MKSLRSDRFGIVRRRGWVLLLTVISVTAAAFAFAHSRASSYAASSYVVVSSGATNSGPGSANEASALATTYAGLIPRDNAIISAVAATLHERPADVRPGISVFTTNSTAVLEVRYTAGTPAEAIAGSRAIVLAIVGPKPATHAIPGGTVLLVSLPTSAKVASSARSTAVPLGAVLGLLLGAVLMIAWERLDPRVDSPNDLAEVIDAPVIVDAVLGGERASGLLQRWTDLAGRSPRPERSGRAPVRVALVSVGEEPATVSASVAQWLSAATATAYKGSPVQLLSFGDPRGPAGAELLAAPADLVVLVVRRDEHSRDVNEAADILRAFGQAADWGLFLEGGRRRAESLALGSAADSAEGDKVGIQGENRLALPPGEGTAAGSPVVVGGSSGDDPELRLLDAIERVRSLRQTLTESSDRPETPEAVGAAEPSTETADPVVEAATASTDPAVTDMDDDGLDEVFIGAPPAPPSISNGMSRGGAGHEEPLFQTSEAPAPPGSGNPSSAG